MGLGWRSRSAPIAMVMWLPPPIAAPALMLVLRAVVPIVLLPGILAIGIMTIGAMLRRVMAIRAMTIGAMLLRVMAIGITPIGVTAIGVTTSGVTTIGMIRVAVLTIVRCGNLSRVLPPLLQAVLSIVLPGAMGAAASTIVATTRRIMTIWAMAKPIGVMLPQRPVPPATAAPTLALPLAVTGMRTEALGAMATIAKMRRGFGIPVGVQEPKATLPIKAAAVKFGM